MLIRSVLLSTFHCVLLYFMLPYMMHVEPPKVLPNCPTFFSVLFYTTLYDAVPYRLDPQGWDGVGVGVFMTFSEDDFQST